jgi:hypothetical protein
MDKELLEKARAVMRRATPEPVVKQVPAKPMTSNLLDTVKKFSINRPCRFEIVARQVAPCPVGPVNVTSDFPIFGPPDHQVRSTIAVPYVTILDPAKFVSATLADLASYVSAKNQGRQHSWIEDIVDEKIEQLRLCGVEAEIRTMQ